MRSTTVVKKMDDNQLGTHYGSFIARNGEPWQGREDVAAWRNQIAAFRRLERSKQIAILTEMERKEVNEHNGEHKHSHRTFNSMRKCVRAH